MTGRENRLIYLSFVKKGRKIPINDVWISACCRITGGSLITRVRHFGEIDQIDKIILDKGRGKGQEAIAMRSIFPTSLFSYFLLS